MLASVCWVPADSGADSGLGGCCAPLSWEATGTPLGLGITGGLLWDAGTHTAPPLTLRSWS